MEFKQYQKLCLKEFKQAEIDYINKTIQDGFENNNCKPFWRYIKAKKQDNIGVAPLKLIFEILLKVGTFSNISKIS